WPSPPDANAVSHFRGPLHKQHVEPLTGHVVRLFHDEGYGFVHTDTGDVYMHRNAVVDDGFDRLEVGAEVRLEIAEGESPQGWQATTVTPTGNVLKVSG
ncbi:MAG: cold shock domain-containing protein, partial [Pseudomonadota bacterium]